jgi:hypothetical protein
MKDFLFYGRIRQTQTTIIHKMQNIDTPPYEQVAMQWHSVYPKETMTATQVRTIVQEVFNTVPNVCVENYDPENWCWNWEYGTEPMEEQMQREHGYSAVYNRSEAIQHAIQYAQKKFPHNLEYDDEDNAFYEPCRLPNKWSRGSVEIRLTKTGPNITVLKTAGDGSSFILFNAIKEAFNM